MSNNEAEASNQKAASLNSTRSFWRPGRISILSALMFMLAVAVGSRNSVLHGRRLEDFFFGMVSTYIAFGLVQQIVFRYKHSQLRLPGILRILFLSFLLFGMGWGCYRTVVPYPINDPAAFPNSQLKLSKIAAPVWFCSVLLGTFTSPWMLIISKTTKSALSKTWRCGVGLTLLALFISLFLLWTIIPVLVQVAINGISLGLRQPATMQAGLSLETFGPSARQLSDFVFMQVISWPLLLAAIGILAFYCRSNVPSSQRRRLKTWSVTALFLGILVLPIVNAIWLINGAAHTIAPQLVETYFEEPRPDLDLGMFLLVLATIYIGLPRNQKAEEEANEPAWCWNDSWIVGICMVVVGCIIAFKTIRFGVASGLIFTSDFFLSLLEAPNEHFLLIALPAGCSWLWMKYRYQGDQKNRWPNLEPKHVVVIPLLSFTLLMAIALSFPFGIAFALFCC